MTIKDFQNKLEKINPRDIFFQNADSMKDEFIGINKTQLMQGLSTLGKDLRPYYSEDNYFKSPESAKRYIEWKQRITPNSLRNPDAPNLFITGKFHSGFYLTRSGDNFIINSTDKNTSKIKSKFVNIFGFTPANKEIVKNKLLTSSWLKIIKLLKNG